MLDIDLEFLGSIIGAVCCSQCPAALVNLLCSMPTTQKQKSNTIAVEATVASVCNIAYVMVWLCGVDNTTNAINVSIAAECPAGEVAVS